MPRLYPEEEQDLYDDDDDSTSEGSFEMISETTYNSTKVCYIYLVLSPKVHF